MTEKGREPGETDGEVPWEPKGERILITRDQKSVARGLNHRIREAERTWVICSKILIFIEEKTEAHWREGMICSKSLKGYNTSPKASTLTDNMEFSSDKTEIFPTTLLPHMSTPVLFNKYLLHTYYTSLGVSDLAVTDLKDSRSTLKSLVF